MYQGLVSTSHHAIPTCKVSTSYLLYFLRYGLSNKQSFFVTGVLSAASEAAGNLSPKVTREAANNTALIIGDGCRRYCGIVRFLCDNPSRKYEGISRPPYFGCTQRFNFRPDRKLYFRKYAVPTFDIPLDLQKKDGLQPATIA